MGAIVNGKHEFTSANNDRIAFDGEVWRVYGSKKKWAYNTAADLIVEIGAAWWMVL